MTRPTQRMRGVAFVVFLVAVSPMSARADEPEANDDAGAQSDAASSAQPDSSASEGASATPDAPLPEGQRRPLPNYDGRPEPGPSAGEIALWIPRIVFSPLYLFSEFVLRRPLNWMFTELERMHAFTWMLDIFTFGPNRQAGIIPTAFYEFGFRPSVGLYTYWNGFLSRENRIALQLATGGSDWWLLNATDISHPLPSLLMRFNFTAFERPDQIFAGIGWNATQNLRSRYQIDQIDASFLLSQMVWRRSALDYELGFRTASFQSRAIFGDPGVGQRGPIPPGFLTGYNAFRAGLSTVFDTHELEELATGGVRARAWGMYNVGFGGLPSTSQWFNWGGSLLLSGDAGFGRVFSIRGDVGFISTLDRSDPQNVVPFTELLDVGGDGPLRGFWNGWIRGYSMAAVSVIYVWPVWAFLDAHIRVAVGNAFGPYLDDFQLERLRLSFDIGMDPRFGGEHPFELLFGIGTQTFSAGTEIASIRFAIGTRTGI